MLTPTHMIINTAVLRKIDQKVSIPAAVLGGLLPDTPMFVFFIYERFFMGMTDHQQIWHRDFFLPQWQAFFDIPHSFLIVGIAYGISYISKKSFWKTLFLSMILHSGIDFFMHHDDAHRHFYPFDFRFMSPVSYWDPQHYGWLGSGIETVAVICASVYLYLHLKNKWAKGGLIAWNLLFILTFVMRFIGK